MEEDKSRQINKVTSSYNKNNKNEPRVELGKTFLHGAVRDIFSAFDVGPKG